MVVEIDRNPGAYPDGNVAEVRFCGYDLELDVMMVNFRTSGPVPKRKHRLWTVSHCAKLVMPQREFASSSISIISPPSISFTPNLVGLYIENSFRWISRQIANLLCLKDDSRINVINALWNYIRINGLQDKVDRRTVRTNDELRAVSSPKTGSTLHC